MFACYLALSNVLIHLIYIDMDIISVDNVVRLAPNIYKTKYNTFLLCVQRYLSLFLFVLSPRLCGGAGGLWRGPGPGATCSFHTKGRGGNAQVLLQDITYRSCHGQCLYEWMFSANTLK